MKEIFSLKTRIYPIRMQYLNYQTLALYHMELNLLVTREAKFGKEIPKKFKNVKTYIVSKNCENLRKCNSCKLYVPKLWYIEHTS